jgi:hypothetical protein
MKTTLTCLIISIALLTRASDWKKSYAPLGQLIVSQFTNAPFPHPQRAQGHEYKKEMFDAANHYSDNTVAIFIPKNFRASNKVDLVVHFHGWKNHVESVLKNYQLIDQFVASRRNAILVVPQGPYDAPDSFGGKLEDPDGFKHFVEEVLGTLRSHSSLTNAGLRAGGIILSGHSGGYQVISAILDRGGMQPDIREVFLFDALYAQTPRFLSWFDRSHGRMINIYTEHGGTKEETEKLLQQLRDRGTPVLQGNEKEIAAGSLRTNTAVFIYSDLPHNEVVNKRAEFQNFLETSSFGEIGK